MTKMNLRLLLFEECNRSCPKCCNKQFDIANLPVLSDDSEFNDYELIMLTGGEPMLNPNYIIETAYRIFAQNRYANIILYTADVRDYRIFDVLSVIQGLTLTLHEPYDEIFLARFLSNLKIKQELEYFNRNLSLRLNVFEGIELSDYTLEACKNWQIKTGIKWLDDCPLPAGEVFKRLS